MFFIRKSLKILVNHEPQVALQQAVVWRRCINTTFVQKSNNKNTKENNEEKFEEDQEKQLMIRGSFEQIRTKNRDTYLDMVRIFENRTDKNRRNHVEFIYAALKNMHHFGVHKDLAVYKALINVMPKGKFIPQNVIQVEFQHYPKQQQCIIDLLEQMEDNGVMVRLFKFSNQKTIKTFKFFLF